MKGPVRVLVVDDSAFARKVVTETLRADHRFEVVGIARDGLEALEKVAELTPDVLTLDLVMPNLDGLGVLRALPAQSPPRVVVVSMSDADSELGIEALRAGAFDLVHKPTAIATDRLYDLGPELVEKVAAAGDAQPRPVVLRTETVEQMIVPQATSRAILVVGTSTGGPQALMRILSELPASFPIPIAIVLHIPHGYTGPFAARVNQESALEIVEAYDGLVLRPGMAVIARAGEHLMVAKRGDELVAQLSLTPGGMAHRPSVDVLFGSVATLGRAVLAVVMTGMGDDGLVGARQIAAAGGTVLTESESSCIVYGMPRAVDEAKLASATAPLDSMTSLILSKL